ncbi:Hsp20 family protein [Streptomyces mexicanus]|uniref:Hsp20 family protein n=1 Tax=Streptomyces mexicanus TaxID=178566 RepID=A0A7X1I4C8_9ACTN|nr:Hsp20 family protein [Streptomyces mexicanus]
MSEAFPGSRGLEAEGRSARRRAAPRRFSRQPLLGDSLGPETITAHYDAGLLTVNIPVAEEAKPRRIEIYRKGAQ